MNRPTGVETVVDFEVAGIVHGAAAAAAVEDMDGTSLMEAVGTDIRCGVLAVAVAVVAAVVVAWTGAQFLGENYLDYVEETSVVD